MKALLQKNGFIHYQSDTEYSNEDYQTLINEINFLIVSIRMKNLLLLHI